MDLDLINLGVNGRLDKGTKKQVDIVTYWIGYESSFHLGVRTELQMLFMTQTLYLIHGKVGGHSTKARIELRYS